MVSPQSKHIFNFLETIISLGHDQTLPPGRTTSETTCKRSSNTHKEKTLLGASGAESRPSSPGHRGHRNHRGMLWVPTPALGAGSPAPPGGCSPRAPAPTAAIRWNCASHPGSSALRATFLRSPSPRTPRRAPGGQQRGAVATGQESSADSSLTVLACPRSCAPWPRANRTRAHRTRRSPGRGRHGHR